MILNKFFRWLYNPEEPDHRKRMTPACMQGIKRLPRKQKTSYKPSDIWEAVEYAIFLKYCPSKRDRCYHAMANDTSARPHEIINLRVKDIRFCVTEEGAHYAEVRIVEGKTGPRTVPLIDSIPYLKEYLLEEHPSGSNPNSWLFVSMGNNHGSKLTYEGLSSHYEYYKKRYFPSLLYNDTVPEPDKSLIRNLLTKPWNLYIFRHSALTEKSQVLTTAVLSSHAGWTMSSKIPQVYLHLSDESSKILLEKKGLIRKGDLGKANVLKSKLCRNCFEPNRQDLKFCAHCRMVLSFSSYQETLLLQNEKESLNFRKYWFTDPSYKHRLTLFRWNTGPKIYYLSDSKKITPFDNKIYPILRDITGREFILWKNNIYRQERWNLFCLLSDYYKAGNS